MSDAVQLTKVSKIFTVSARQAKSLRHRYLAGSDPLSRRVVTVLRDISLTIPSGQCLGIIGPNGSGKSTLLRLIAGVYAPSSGSIYVGQSIAPVLELGVGFQEELTGRENIFLNAAMLGIARQTILERLPKLLAIAGTESHLDIPLKKYSTGMRARLAFAIAVQSHADMLLFDEVFAVGDVSFRQQCFDLLRQLKTQGKTILLVSHDVSAITQLCDHCIYLKDATLAADGSPDQVVQEYLADAARS